MTTEDNSNERKQPPPCGIRYDSCGGYADWDEAEDDWLEVDDRYACQSCYNRKHMSRETRESWNL